MQQKNRKQPRRLGEQLCINLIVIMITDLPSLGISKGEGRSVSTLFP